MSKPNLYFDFDNTLFYSNKAMPIVYEQLTGIKLKSHLTVDWNMRDLYYKESDYKKEFVHKVFEVEEFFKPEYIYNGVHDVLQNLLPYFNLYVVSCGTTINLELKSKFLLEQFPYIPLENHIMLEQSKKVFDKSCCSGKGSIIIDDRLDCLENANTDYKILYRHDNQDLIWQKGFEDKLLSGEITCYATTWDKNFEKCLINLANKY